MLRFASTVLGLALLAIGALAQRTEAPTIRIENGQHFYDFDYTLPE